MLTIRVEVEMLGESPTKPPGGGPEKLARANDSGGARGSAGTPLVSLLDRELNFLISILGSLIQLFTKYNYNYIL